MKIHESEVTGLTFCPWQDVLTAALAPVAATVRGTGGNDDERQSKCALM
jgi:hypothetical protein